jgi:hypothetical protein
MNPDWYAAWREEASEQLNAKNARLQNDFRLGSWPRYDYHLKAGKLLFSEEGSSRSLPRSRLRAVRSPRPAIGCGPGQIRTGLASSSADAKLVRSFGEENAIDELAQPYVTDMSNDLEALDWELAGAMVRICNALGAYRSPRGEGGGLYLIFKNISWAN